MSQNKKTKSRVRKMTIGKDSPTIFVCPCCHKPIKLIQHRLKHYQESYKCRKYLVYLLHGSSRWYRR